MDRRGFLAQLISSGFGLIAGQTVSVKPVEHHIQPAKEMPRVLALDGVVVENAVGRIVELREELRWEIDAKFIAWGNGQTFLQSMQSLVGTEYPSFQIADERLKKHNRLTNP